jgi:hypothetical protein
MPFRFNRRFGLLPGVRLNLSKSGASVSLGVRGAHVTLGRRGIRTTLGLPGTGLSWTEQSPWPAQEPPAVLHGEVIRPDGNIAPSTTTFSGRRIAIAIAVMMVGYALITWLFGGGH